MTCKDCLHYGVCYTQETCNDIEQQLKDFGCNDFTDRSKWVRLPCNVGVIVWYITGIHHSLIKSARVEEIIINETGIRELYVSTENGCYFQNDITTFYFTREAAEKALEEKK